MWLEKLKFLGGSENRKTSYQWEHEVRGVHYIGGDRCALLHSYQPYCLIRYMYSLATPTNPCRFCNNWDMDGTLTGFPGG